MKKCMEAIVMTCLVAATWAANASEATVKALLVKKYASLPPNVVVKKLPIADLYEVNLLGQEAYTNEKVEYLLVGGSLVNTAKLEDVTAARKPQFLRDFFLALPLDKAIKTVYGKGEKVLVTFEDPDCPLCRAQHEEWNKNPVALNATVYAFMFPLRIHPDARRKAEFIWCQPDPAAAWSTWMTKSQGLPLDSKGNLSASAGVSCAEGVAKVDASEGLARSLGYHETPRFIFPQGLGASGVLTLAQFAEAYKNVDKSLAALAELGVKAPEASIKPGVAKTK